MSANPRHEPGIERKQGPSLAVRDNMIGKDLFMAYFTTTLNLASYILIDFMTKKTKTVH